MKIASPQPRVRLTLRAASDLLWPWNPDHHHCQIGPGSIYIFLSVSPPVYHNAVLTSPGTENRQLFPETTQQCHLTEQCPQFHVYSEPVDMTLFGNKAFADKIMLS